MSTAARRIVAVGACCAALAVAVGAFGAHALQDRVAPDMLANYETGARYHFYHALGIILVGLVAHLQASRPGTDEPYAAYQAFSARLGWSAWLMLTGIVLFSGSLYLMALTDQRWLGAVTPLGGVSFIAAWVLLAWAAFDW